MAVTPLRAGPAPRHGWLCPTEFDRARCLDMQERVRTARLVQLILIGSASLFASLSFGWWLAGLVVVAVPIAPLLDRIMLRIGRPEVAGATSVALLELVLGAGVFGTGGGRSPLLSFLAVPVMMMAARYRTAVVVTAVGLSLGLLAAVVAGAAALGISAQCPVAVHVLAYLALAGSVTATVLALLAAEIQSRGEAVVDPLTGLFNRKALQGRFDEAAAQAQLIGAPVSLMIVDLDHFKQVNDNHGHDRGDAVLREAAHRLRTALRVFDLVYRIGGEEFVVLLPGQDEAAARQLAERLVRAVAEQPLAGLPVTASAGVAGARGRQVELRALLKQADLALYEAKAGGRNCVRAAPGEAAASAR